MERERTANETGKTDGRNASVALLIIQILLGYEWLASGLTKLVHGDFPGGLAGDLAERSKDASGWYRSFRDAAVIPHAHAFGYAIEIAELLTGSCSSPPRSSGFAAGSGSAAVRGERCSSQRPRPPSRPR